MFGNKFKVQEIEPPSRIIQTVIGRDRAYFLDYYGRVYSAVPIYKEKKQ